MMELNLKTHTHSDQIRSGNVVYKASFHSLKAHTVNAQL